MPDLALVPKSELDRVRGAADAEPDARLALLADMCRLNTLVAIKCAGSGHLGSSFSALDIMVHLLYEELNVAELGFDHPERDVFFSSKGHDVPGLYAALYGLGVLPQEQLLRLRRLGGLDGHPDVGIPGIEANSGSLGMGISKGRGIAWAKWSLGFGGRVVVMTGDGELQEGQNWEALQAAAHERLGTLWVVVDRNELQSDKPTEEIVALGDLEAKLRGVRLGRPNVRRPRPRGAAGGIRRVQRDRRPPERAHCTDDEGQGRLVHGALGGTRRRRRVLHVARGRSRRRRLRARTRRARREDRRPRSRSSASARSSSHRSRSPQTHVSYSLEGEPESGAGAPLHKVTEEYVVEAYGEALVELGASNDRIVVLDADLASDCRVRGFELAFPDRFVECGIAEQDMVSTAAGSRAPRLPPRGELVRVIPRLARQRADLQPGERGVEGRLRAPLRGAHSRGTGEVAPERARRLAPRRASEHDDRPAGYLRRDARASPLGARGGGGERRHPARDRSLAPSDRARFRL